MRPRLLGVRACRDPPIWKSSARMLYITIGQSPCQRASPGRYRCRDLWRGRFRAVEDARKDRTAGQGRDGSVSCVAPPLWACAHVWALWPQASGASAHGLGPMVRRLGEWPRAPDGCPQLLGPPPPTPGADGPGLGKSPLRPGAADQDQGQQPPDVGANGFCAGGKAGRERMHRGFLDGKRAGDRGNTPRGRAPGGGLGWSADAVSGPPHSKKPGGSRARKVRGDRRRAYWPGGRPCLRSPCCP
jgi:hypothetical protein